MMMPPKSVKPPTPRRTTRAKENPQVVAVKESGEMFRLYIECDREALTNARVKAVETRTTLAVVLGNAINKAFATKG